MTFCERTKMACSILRPAVSRVGKVALILFVVAASIGFIATPESRATTVSPFTLSQGNTVIEIDPCSAAGMNKWAINGTDYLANDWYWYSVGSMSTQVPLNNLNASPVVTQFSLDGDAVPDAAAITYSSNNFDVRLLYTLQGGQSDFGNSQLNAQATLFNKTNSPLTVHFFQYADLDLLQDADTVYFPNQSHVTQTATGMFAEQVITGLPNHPNHYEAGLATDLLAELNGASYATLNDNRQVDNANGAWAFQWDITIPARGSYLIGREITLNVPNTSNVPEPSTCLLLAAAIPGILIFRRCRRAALNR